MRHGPALKITDHRDHGHLTFEGGALLHEAFQQNGHRQHSTERQPQTVAVATESEIVRLGLFSMLDLASDFQPLRHRVTPGTAVSGEYPVDFVIAEFDGHFVDDLKELTEKCRNDSISVLLLVSSTDREELDLAIQVPAQGFLLLAELTPDELNTALSKVAAGSVHLPPVFANRLLTRARREESSALSPQGRTTLTPRELQTLELLVEGLSNKQIARRLAISQHGAKRLVANVLSKLNCHNRTMAAAVALREHLVSRPGSRARETR